MSIRKSSDRPPLEEIAKRTGEAGAGLIAAVHAGAVREHVNAQGAYARRVADDHAAGMVTAGMAEAGDFSPPEDESMGNITVTGDLYGDTAVNALRDQIVNAPGTQSPMPPPESPPPTETRGMSPLAKALVTLGAAALIPGIGVPLLAAFGAFDKPPAQTEFTDTDTDTDIYPSVIVEHRDTPPPVDE